MRLIDVSTRSFPSTFAQVDDDDYDRLAPFKWTATRPRNVTYAVRSAVVDGRKTTVRMHCEILGVLRIDHADGDGLNNQRHNLRPCTEAQNQYNRRRARGASKYKGVSWHKSNEKWRATIVVEGVQHSLGYFDIEEEAAAAYDGAAARYFGEFAATNFGAIHV